MKITTDKSITIESYDIFTYRRIRRAIGYLTFSLPIVLVSLSFISFFSTSLQESISHYYYTNLREVFTGTLCAVGLFLLRYKGHGNKSILKNDNFLTNLAGLMALGVAFVPTNSDDPAQKIYTLIPYQDTWLGWLHYGFAGLLFLICSLLSINVFTLGQEQETGTEESIFNENNIYRFCGYAIIVFIAMVPVAASFNLFPNSTLLFEALSLFAFGISWLVKGRALGDKGALGKKVYKENNPVGTEKAVEELEKSEGEKVL